MWNNPRLLNMTAGALFGIALLAFAVGAIWWLLHSPRFPVTRIEVTQPLRHTTEAEIQAAAHARIRGNFFSVSTEEVRAGLEELPWVRRASVRRVWPDRLQVALEEQVPLARWGDDALVNIYGERFPGHASEPLPLFFGPAGTEREIALRYARFSEILSPLGAKLERVIVTARYAWQLRLSNGLHIALGRDVEQGEARLRKLVAVYPATLGKIAGPHDFVDLRYPNGFALRVPELKG